MTEETNNDKKLSRQTEWFVLGAFATVALSAVTSSTLLEDKLPDVDKEVKWVTIVLAVTVGFSGLAFFAHLIKRDRFVGTPIEGGLALLTVGLLASAMHTMMDPDNNMAIAEVGKGFRTIQFANLYFPVWFALISGMMVFGRYLYHHTKLIQNKEGPNCFAWTLLAASSLVVLTSSMRSYDALECDDDKTDRCKRLKLSVSAGAVTAILPLIMLFVPKSKFPQTRFLEEGLALCFLALWTITLVFVNFGDENEIVAPVLGNLYFSVYLSFFASVLLFTNAIENMVKEFTEDAVVSTDAKKEDNPVAEAEDDEESPTHVDE